MPVMSASEMFVNFHYLGLVAFAFIWWGLNLVYIRWHRIKGHSFAAHSYLFLSITVLMLARGSGIEQYLLYYFFAVPLFLMHAFIPGGSAERAPALGRGGFVMSFPRRP